MAWQIFKRLTCNIESDIVRFDGRELAVTDSDLTNQSVEINRHGWITWGQQDLCLNPWEGKIMLYAEGEISVLPSRASQAQAPATNDLGQVSWGTSEAGIEIWESGETRVVLDEGSNVRLNNLGDMYFLRFNSQTYWDGYLYRISNGEPVVHRLTDDPVWNIDGDINDWTEVVWRWKLQGESHGGIRLLRRIRTGDSEFDQDIDLDDFRAFSNCMTGPVRSDRLCDCRFLDIDHDGDVDLADFSRVQLGFTGDE